ncbi:unnamed protein product [Phytophthora fragariaefolia]|uniref:Unnamed protein product n=1 Tax=Phytophthora fragariaefolia TaxID=1490495 RepID=A0A9W6YF42_9STRA|nr:unnamed protein product [Phytophthora fragariaefolia]
MSGSSATWSTASSSTAPTTSSATATSTAASAGASTRDCCGFGKYERHAWWRVHVSWIGWKWSIADEWNWHGSWSWFSCVGSCVGNASDDGSWSWFGCVGSCVGNSSDDGSCECYGDVAYVSATFSSAMPNTGAFPATPVIIPQYSGGGFGMKLDKKPPAMQGSFDLYAVQLKTFLTRLNLWGVNENEAAVLANISDI